MITKPLPRHHDLAALIFYLFKEGRQQAAQHEADHTECLHVDPHLVAAWDPSLLDGQLLDGKPARPDEAGQRTLVDLMDSPRLLFGVNLKAGHVYHVPIAVHPDDGALGDQRWAELAEQAVAAIGVQNCRWVAVCHGPNASGADHIHLAVQLVGEDGNAARLSYDKRRLREWANDVEERQGLVCTARPGSGARGLSRAEHERAKATATEPERRRLARLVRSAAAGAHDEVDWLAALKDKNVDVRPRVEQGLVVGYSVALAPAGLGGKSLSTGAQALRLGGGQLARDLTLPRLREQWPPPKDPVAEEALLAHWEAPGELPEARRPGLWIIARSELSRARSAASALDPADQARWNTAISETAELVCVLAVRLERGQAGPLHRAGDALLDAARLGRLRDTGTGWKDSFHQRPVVLPMLSRAARIAAHSADPAPVIALAVLAIVALLLYDLATRQRYDQHPGQSGAALRRAAGELAEHRPMPANLTAAGPPRVAAVPVDRHEVPAGTEDDVSAASTAPTAKRSLTDPAGSRPATNSSAGQPQAISRPKAR